MVRSGAVAALIATTLGSACSATTIPSEQPTPPSATPITQLPAQCGKVRDSNEAQISFIKGGRLYVADALGREVACVAEVDQPDPIFWSPDGTKAAIAGFTSVDIFSDGRASTIEGPQPDPMFLGFSQPDGSEGLFVTSDGATLELVDAATGEKEDISFLRRHDEAVFEPGGSRIAVLGEPEGEKYGIFVVSERGKDVQRLVETGDEDNFYGLSYSSTGDKLLYIADFHTRWELQSIDAEPTGQLAEPTVLASSRQPILPIVSASSDDVAYRDGVCNTGFSTFVVSDGTSSEVIEDGDSQPIGWLSEGQLVTGLADDLCDLNRTMDLFVGDDDNRDPLIEDVDEAAVRPAG